MGHQKPPNVHPTRQRPLDHRPKLATQTFLPKQKQRLKWHAHATSPKQSGVTGAAREGLCANSRRPPYNVGVPVSTGWGAHKPRTPGCNYHAHCHGWGAHRPRTPGCNYHAHCHGWGAHRPRTPGCNYHAHCHGWGAHRRSNTRHQQPRKNSNDSYSHSHTTTAATQLSTDCQRTVNGTVNNNGQRTLT